MKIGKKAFTLIELMIVVVILGVLMSTVLPKLTGAQARSRDAGRIADLGNIAAALQVYYDDNGYYPTETDKDDVAVGYCLGSTGGVSDDIKIYMQSQKVPVDPQPTSNKYLCGKDTTGAHDNIGNGQYYYAALTKNGLKRNAYLLCADMETLQKANTDATYLVDAGGGVNTTATEDTDNVLVATSGVTKAEYEDILSLVGNTKLTSEASDATGANAGTSVYCILRP